jgi:micrococcal nuclease
MKAAGGGPGGWPRFLLGLLLLGPFLLRSAAPAHAAGPVHGAAVLEGTVTHVTDGDTLWLRPAGGGRPVKLRLQGIDAPEICQPWGLQSRQALAALVLRQAVRVSVVARDAHGRRVGRLMRGRVDVAAQLVRDGHAWSQRYRRDAGPYAAQEQQARAAGRGLFAAQPPAPEPPRDFRKRHGPCR